MLDRTFRTFFNIDTDTDKIKSSKTPHHDSYHPIFRGQFWRLFRWENLLRTALQFDLSPTSIWEQWTNSAHKVCVNSKHHKITMFSSLFRPRTSVAAAQFLRSFSSTSQVGTHKERETTKKLKIFVADGKCLTTQTTHPWKNARI